MHAWQTGVVLAAAGGAGWVDAVVGGGGLLLIPAMLLANPAMPVATVLGTNKLAAVTGTATAAVTYTRRTAVNWRLLAPMTALAVLCAGCGAVLAGSVPARVYRPIVLGVLAAVALLVTLRPGLGQATSDQPPGRWRTVAAFVAGGVLIGLYDGAVGPGTGTFLIISFSALLAVDFVHASAMAKVINVGTNLGALAVFAASGHVSWLLGLAMAVCNMTGARLGARMALRRGSGFVRIVLLVVVLALLVKLGHDQFV